MDPICGTRPFASNLPFYCTNIALVEEGEVTAAAIGVGRTGEVLYAEKDGGAFLRFDGADRPIAVSDANDTIWIDGETEQAAEVVRKAILRRRWYVWQFSSSVAYAYLASGRIAGVLHFSSKSAIVPIGSVHAGAGCFIGREAGAIVTDLSDGGLWKLQTPSFLMAATPQLHHQLFDLVRGE